MRLFTAAAAAVVLLSASTIASARTLEFTVLNKTGYTLTAVYTGPSSSDDWGSNILDGRLANGDEMVVSIADAATCMYDFRYEFKGHDTYEEFKINICEIDGDEFIIR